MTATDHEPHFCHIRNGDVSHADAMVARVRAELGTVRMLPDVAAQALDLAKNPDASIDEFARIIQRDVELAANVLSLANSALFSSKPTASLAQSIARVGFNRCKNLILASSLSSLMKKMSLEEEWIRDVLWRHSVLTAVLSSKLNTMLRTAFEGEEFTAGLIHDFGRTLFATVESEHFQTFDPLDFVESFELLQREVDVMGLTHCELGARYAIDQGLPEPLVEVIRSHHQPQFCGNHQKLVALTAAADHIANHYHIHDDMSQYSATENAGLVILECLGVPRATQAVSDQIVDLLEDSLESAKDMFAL